MNLIQYYFLFIQYDTGTVLVVFLDNLGTGTALMARKPFDYCDDCFLAANLAKNVRSFVFVLIIRADLQKIHLSWHFILLI